jgi:uncharacterized protein YlaI
MAKKNIRKCNRSGNEKCAICNITTKLVEHHIKGREIPNCNHPSNLVWICPNCHDKIHSNDIKIDGWYFTTDGMKLVWDWIY